MSDEPFWPADPNDDLCPCGCNDGLDTLAPAECGGTPADIDDNGDYRPIVDLTDRPRLNRVDEMVAWVGNRTGLAPREIKSGLRQIEHARARWAVMWAARQSIGLSTPQIGQRLGRDHTTVIHGLRRAETLRSTHLPFRELTNALCAAFPPFQTKEHVR